MLVLAPFLPPYILKMIRAMHNFFCIRHKQNFIKNLHLIYACYFHMFDIMKKYLLAFVLEWRYKLFLHRRLEHGE